MIVLNSHKAAQFKEIGFEEDLMNVGKVNRLFTITRVVLDGRLAAISVEDGLARIETFNCGSSLSSACAGKSDVELSARNIEHSLRPPCMNLHIKTLLLC